MTPVSLSSFVAAMQLILLRLPLSSSSTTTASSSSSSIPKVHVHDLSQPKQRPQKDEINLHDVLLKSGGILRISSSSTSSSKYNDLLPTNLGAIRHEALSSMCDCHTIFSPPSRSNPSTTALTASNSNSSKKDVRQIILMDGSVRRTLATATIGFPYNDNNNHNNNDIVYNDNEDEAAEGGALELPTWIDTACRLRNDNDIGQDGNNSVRDSLEELRDAVAYIVNLFITKLDTELNMAAALANNEDDTHNFNYYRQLLERENHLEHFHVYTKKKEGDEQQQEHHQLYDDNNRNKGNELLLDNNNNDDSATAMTTTLDYHTDAGFFLAFVPAMDCHTRAIDNSSFHLQHAGKHDGDDKSDSTPVFDDNDVIIIMGAAAEHWLPPHPLDDNNDNNVNMDGKWRKKFLAMSHALHLSPGAHRTWYGKMHLLPMSLQQLQKQSTLTGNKKAMPPSFQLKDYNAHVPNSPVDGCGVRVRSTLDDDDDSNGGGGEKNTTLTTNAKSSRRNRQRRRLQHVNSPANCNNITDFFCWYQCLDIPNSSDAEANVKGGNSLYCLDPSLLSSSSSVSDATKPCRNGYVHNSHCIGSWQKTDDNVPGYALPYKTSTEDNSSDQQELSINTISKVAPDEYCYGGTSMYMDGFTWQGSACVIYLFRSWVLTTPLKFAFAVVGSLCLGILLEYVLRARRRVYALSPGNRRLLMSTLFYGLQLTMGYFNMLVIMTYSGPLFISTVGGMMIGHVIFNAQDALMKRWKEKEYDGRKDGTEDIPEAAVVTASNARNRELCSYQNGTISVGLVKNVNNGYNNVKSSPEKDIENLSDMSATSSEIRRDIADGVTPCCQYTL